MFTIKLENCFLSRWIRRQPRHCGTDSEMHHWKWRYRQFVLFCSASIYYCIGHVFKQFSPLVLLFLSQPIWRPSKTCLLGKTFVNIKIHGIIITFVIFGYFFFSIVC